MTKVTVSDDVVTIRFTRWEKIAGLLRDIRVPASAVSSVEVVPDGLAAASGLRAPGLAIPGRRKIGTWRRRGGKSAVSVRRGRPALRLRLDGQPHESLLLDVEGPHEVARALSTAAGR